ncbi:cytosolic carboxypeptidase 2 isoform X4 [Catharus ustulatus]|uniref:cytosolic carboxypeptidase 2 isoform X4 n=1 Tax=Catharus ustulatus TaxID=91951 RepID=UPI00140D38F2|nr:cytosolic carboxypeptidase 2 isoform X4 [Catharus ustulatus]
MEPVGRCATQVGGEGAPRVFGGGQVLKPYDSFIRTHLRFYGYFRGEPWPPCAVPSCPWAVSPPASWLQCCSPQDEKTGREETAMSPGQPSRQHPKASTMGNTGSGWQRGPGHKPNRDAQAPFSLPAPRWPVECEVIQETIEHIEWIPPKPEPFCPPMGREQSMYTLSEEQGTTVYHCPALQASCFTRARVGGAPGPLSSPAAPLEGPQDTTLLFESRFESGNLEKAIKVGPYEYVLMLRPDLYTAKHTQWFYFRVQNTRQEPLYRFTIANMAKPKSLYGQGLQPLLYSQQDAQSRGIGWRRVGTDICYCRGSAGELPLFRLSWTVRFPHDGDTCFFASCYPYTYSDLQRYLRALAADPARSRYCTVQVLCRSLAGNSVYLLTITGPGGTAGKQVVVASARVHPGESGGSWAMRGFLDFLLSAHADAQLLRRLFVFKVVPMLNPDGVVVGNSRCSLAGRDPNRAYGMALPGSFPGVWHLRAMVQRMLAEQEVVLYCDFHGHSRKNNVFMYGCDASRDDTGTRLRQRVFPLMLSKNAPDKFSFSSCKFQVQKSKERTGRVCMWRLGVSHSYTLEVAFSGSTLGGRKSHFSMEDLESLGRLLCDTLLEFCDPATAKLQQCLVEADALLQRRMGGEPGSGGSWSNVSPSELESSTSGSDSSVSDGIPDDFHIPDQPMEPRRRKRLQKRRARNGLHQTNRNRTGIPAGTRRHPVLPGVQNGSGRAGEKPRGSSNITIPRAAGAGNGPHAITGEMLGAHSGVALPRAPEGGSSHGATMGKHQLDTGTSAVTHHKPPLSPHHCGASSYSRDPAVGAILGPSWQRGGRRPRDRTRPLTVPAVASRCYACARQ